MISTGVAGMISRCAYRYEPVSLSSHLRRRAQPWLLFINYLHIPPRPLSPPRSSSPKRVYLRLRYTATLAHLKIIFNCRHHHQFNAFSIFDISEATIRLRCFYWYRVTTDGPAIFQGHNGAAITFRLAIFRASTPYNGLLFRLIRTL